MRTYFDGNGDTKMEFRSKLSWNKPIDGKKPIKVKVGGLVFGNGVKIITFFLVH